MSIYVMACKTKTSLAECPPGPSPLPRPPCTCTPFIMHESKLGMTHTVGSISSYYGIAVRTSWFFLTHLWHQVMGDVEGDTHQCSDKTDNDEDIECLRSAVLQQKDANSDVDNYIQE